MNNMPEEYRGLISFLGKALPEEYDTILFDLREKGYPVIEQGDWGSENVGDVRRCLTDLMKKGKARNNESIYNVIVPTRKSKLLKASFFFMKENGRPVSALALVTELDMFLRMNSFLTRRLTIMGPDGTEEIVLGDIVPDGHQITDPDEIETMVRQFCDDPSELTPSERKELFLDMYDTGAFKIKGSIPKAAEAMGISEKTIYRYISEIKKLRK